MPLQVEAWIGLAGALRACEIYEGDLATLNLAVVVVLGLDHDAEYQVRPARVVVHASSADLAGLQAQVEGVQGVPVLVELPLVGILDVDHSRLRILPNLELLSCRSHLILVAVPCEQIDQLVQVELDHVARKAHSEVLVSLQSLFDVEHFLKAARDDSRVVVFTGDRVRLAGARLAIGEDAHVVPVDRALDEHLRVLEYGFLSGGRIEARVELEFLKLVVGLLG